MQELRLACRRLLRRPGFALFVTLTVAVGIGATTAAFTIADALVLTPAPFADAGRLVVVESQAAQSEDGGDGISYADFEDLRDELEQLDGLATFSVAWDFNVPSPTRPVRVEASFVSAGFFSLLGVGAARGRTFEPGEDADPGTPAHVVLSDSFWRRHFAADPNVVGTTLRLDDTAFTVVGVLPASFRDFLPESRPDVWVPVSMASRVFNPGYLDASGRSFRWLKALGRLRSDGSLARAEAELQAVSARLAERHPQTNRGVSARLVPLGDYAFGGRDLGSTTLALLVGGAFVLLIGCVNVANLLLVRAHGARGEAAIRQALGASRWALARPLLAETSILVAAGAVLGIALAWALTKLLVRVSPLPVPDYVDVGLDARVLVATLVLSAVTAVILGGVAALRHVRTDLRAALHEGSRRLSGDRGHTGPVLVIAEVALALVLLVGAGLFLRSALSFRSIDYGFRTQQLVTLHLDLSGERYRADADLRSAYQRLLEPAAALPGVDAVHLWGPGRAGDSSWFRDVVPAGRDASRQDQRCRLFEHRVSTGALEDLAIALRRGRTLLPGDRAESEPVAVISESAARACWGTDDAVGERFSRRYDGGPPFIRVVGVVEDVRHRGRDDRAHDPRDAYYPLEQVLSEQLSLLVASDRDPDAIAAALRAVVREVDPEVPLYDVATMAQRLDAEASESDFYAWFTGVCSAVALALAALGIYAVLSYAVGQRRHELGLRQALGARPVDLIWLVGRRALTLVASGLVLGMVLAWVLFRLVTASLYGVAAGDPVTLIVTTVLLTSTGLAAAAIPALRASRIDPAVALQDD